MTKKPTKYKYIAKFEPHEDEYPYIPESKNLAKELIDSGELDYKKKNWGDFWIKLLATLALMYFIIHVIIWIVR